MGALRSAALHRRSRAVAGCVLAFSFAVFAGPGAASAAGHSDEEGHGYHPHHVAAFGGVTLAEGHLAPTVGAEYEYRLPWHEGLLGIGAVWEGVIDDGLIHVAVLPVTVHPVAELKLFLGPGIEAVHGHVEPLGRIGAGYDLWLGPVALTPLASLDLAAGHLVQVYGVAVGTGF